MKNIALYMVMKTIIMRRRYPFDDMPEEYRFARVFIEPFPVVYSSTDILVTDARSFPVLAEDILTTHTINPECRIVVIAEEEKRKLISSLFPFVEFPMDKGILVFEGIVTGRGTYSIKQGRNVYSDKEKKLMEAMSYGLEPKEIAKKLGTSERTIRRIQSQLLEKTGLENQKQLGIFAFANKWISICD